MKKRIISIILTMTLFQSFNINVNAATANAVISVSTNNTVVGNTGMATLTISSDEHIGQIYGTFTCGGLGDKDLVYSIGGNDSPSKSRTYTINWKAKTVGTYTCEVKNLEIGTLESQEWPTATAKSKTIKVVKATSSSNSNGSSSSGGTTSSKKEYSSDNTLKSLSIEGYDITPEFNKDTTEYKLTVDQSIEKVNVVAKKNYDKASVSGDGEVNLSLGENTIEIKVTAENGNEKKYKIIVSVSDLNPIKTNIGDVEFTLIKKNNDLIEKLEHYEEITIKIEDQDVVAYTNEVTKTTLVLLKDKDNVINYYIYDEKNNKYEEYKYIKINNITLQILEPIGKKDYYKEYKTTINEEEIKIYKLNKKNKIGLIYGKNVATGNTGYYQYDEEEITLSRYYEDELKKTTTELEKLKKYTTIGVAAISLVVIIATIFGIIKTSRRKRKKR